MGVGFIEETMPTEEAEYTALDGELKLGPVLGRESGGFMEEDVSSIGLREHAIEHDNVEVEVGVERGAEPMEEGDRAEAGVRGRTGARVAHGGSDGSQQNPEDSSGDVWVVVKVNAITLWISLRRIRGDNARNGFFFVLVLFENTHTHKKKRSNSQ